MRVESREEGDWESGIEIERVRGSERVPGGTGTGVTGISDFFPGVEYHGNGGGWGFRRIQ